MEKRILLAFVLSFAVLYGFSWLFPSRPSETPAATAKTPAAQSTATTPEAARQPAPPVEPTAGEVRAETVEDTVVDTALYTASLSNAGGVLQSFKLKAYTDASGKAIELINQDMGAKTGWPLAFSTDDNALNQSLERAKFVVKRDASTVSMEFAGEGVAARKTIEFDPQNYQFTFTAALSQDGKPVSYRLVWQAGFGDQSLPDDPKKKQAVYDSSSKFQRVALSSIKEPQKPTTSRVGVEDQYFLATFLLPQDTQTI